MISMFPFFFSIVAISLKEILYIYPDTKIIHQNQNVTDEGYSQVAVNNFQHKIVVLSEEIEAPRGKTAHKIEWFL